MAEQLHKRLIEAQVEVILRKYVDRELTTVQAMDMLELSRSQFFEWIRRYKEGCRDFSIAYSRKARNHKISNTLKGYIMKELEIEKNLIDDPSLPVRYYNYSFIRDQIMKKYCQEVSVPTIIDRAKKGGSILRSRKENITIGR